MLGYFKRKKQAREAQGNRLKNLEEKVDKLFLAVSEMSKKTISQRTMADEEPVTFNQIIDEWLSGAKEGDNAGD